MLRRKIAALLLPFALLGGALTGCAPDPSGQALGDLLSALETNVETTITTAANSADGVLAAAAAEVQQAIDNVSSAYQQDLDKTVTSLQGVEDSTVAQLQVLVQDLSSSAQQVLQQATTSAQQIVNSLPFANHAPQVTTYGPMFVAHPSQGSGTTPITVQGNFFYASQSQYAPTLTLPGTQTPLKPRGLDTQKLVFDVPNGIFAAPAANRFGDVSLGLSLPFPERKDVIFHRTTPGNFALLVTTLPASPVQSLSLTNTTTSSHTAEQPVSKPPGGWSQQSNQDCVTKKNVPYTAYPDQGWTVDTGVVPTITYLYNKNPGGQQVTVPSYTSNVVNISATTEAECFGPVSDGSGDITFQVSFTEEQTVSSSQTGTQSIPIDWGDRLNYPVQPGWRLTATLFNGEVLQFANADNTNPYLAVTTPTPGSVEIAVPAPGQVSTIA